jgi:3-hydroxyacyl-[acyl-carrier-protein] dehydratase
MIDRLRELAPERYVEATKCISMSEDVFNEHFPGLPVFPGSLILEGLAQMSGLFFEYCLKQRGLTQKRAALTMVKRMKYREMVFPGDRLDYRGEVQVFYPEDGYAVMKVRAKRDGLLIAEGELMFGFLDVMDERMKHASDALMELAFKGVNIVE